MEYVGRIISVQVLEGLESLENLVSLCLDRTYFKLSGSDNKSSSVDSDNSRCSSRDPAGGLKYP